MPARVGRVCPGRFEDNDRASTHWPSCTECPRPLGPSLGLRCCWRQFWHSVRAHSDRGCCQVLGPCFQTPYTMLWARMWGTLFALRAAPLDTTRPARTALQRLCFCSVRRSHCRLCRRSTRGLYVSRSLNAGSDLQTFTSDSERRAVACAPQGPSEALGPATVSSVSAGFGRGLTDTHWSPAKGHSGCRTQ